jgi:hypothetical protein
MFVVDQSRRRRFHQVDRIGDVILAGDSRDGLAVREAELASCPAPRGGEPWIWCSIE